MADEPLVEGSPLGDPNAIEDLQHLSQTIHTSSQTRPDTAVAALTFLLVILRLQLLINII